MAEFLILAAIAGATYEGDINSPASRQGLRLLAAPPTVSGGSRKSRLIELRDALLMAVENNRLIAVQRFEPRQAATYVTQEEAFYDPTITIGGQWRQTDVELTSTVDTAGTGSNSQKVRSFGVAANQPTQLGIRKQLWTGGALQANFGTGFADQWPAGAFATFNPYWRSTTTIGLEQPLLRGAAVADLPVFIAQANLRQSCFEFQAAVNRLFRDVEFAYWELSIAYKLTEVQDAAVKYADAVLKKEERKLKLGESSRPEVAQTREHYQRNRVDQLRATNAVLATERNLRQVIGAPGFDAQRFVTVERLPFTGFNNDWDLAVSLMIDQRPEIAARRATVAAARANLNLARNGRLPDVEFVADYTLPGLAGDFNQSVDKMFQDGTYEWTMGVVFNRPVGNRAATAELRRAALEYRRQRAILDRTQFDLIHELQAAYQDVESARRIVEESALLREAAAERLTAYQEHYEIGDLAIDLLLRSQASFTDAQIDEQRAQLNLRKAIAQWEFTQGTIRESRMFYVSDNANAQRPIEFGDSAATFVEHAGK